MLKWLLRGHFKPPLNATIQIVFYCLNELGFGRFEVPKPPMSKYQPDKYDFKHYFYCCI